MNNKIPILEIRNLTKSFGKVQAVNGISFKIMPQQCFGLLGPNGAGKTTTVEIVEGLMKADSGEILFKGEPKQAHNRKDTGIQFQSTTLQDFLTVKENLQMFANFYPKHVPLEELYHTCSLEDFLHRDVKKLSGGQRQRVALALALIGDPELIFLDEPTMGLDPQARRNFWNLIERIKKKNKTVVLTTHYMDEAYELCDEIIIIDQGKIVVQGNPKVLVHNHYEDFQIQIPKAAFNSDGITLPHSIHDEAVLIQSTDIKSSLSTLLKADVKLDDMVIRKPTLEDLFIDLTGHSLRD